MSMRAPFFLTILALCNSAGLLGAEGPTTVFVWPPRPQNPAWLPPLPKPSAESPWTKNDPSDPAVRRQIVVTMRTQREEEERRERLIQHARLKEKAQQMPPIDPDKDDFRKYLKRRELQKEPEWMALLEEHPDARPRDDFADWKRRQPVKEPSQASGKGKDEERAMDWTKWLRADPGLRDPKPDQRSKKPPQSDVKAE